MWWFGAISMSGKAFAMHPSRWADTTARNKRAGEAKYKAMQSMG